MAVNVSAVAPGLMYEIHSASKDSRATGRYMWLPVWLNNNDNDVPVFNKPLSDKSEVTAELAKWYLSPTQDKDVYEIRSGSKDLRAKDRFMWLPVWENNTQNDVRVITKPSSMKTDVMKDLARWYLSPTQEKDVYEIRSASKDSRAKDRYMWLPVWEETKDHDASVITKPLSVRSDMITDLARWCFIPINYKLQALITNFQYDEGTVDKVLSSTIQHELIDSHTLTVNQNDVGASVSRTFTKTVENNFTWGMNQSLGVEVTVGFECGIPFIGGAKTEVKTTFQLGFNQEWSKTESKEMSVTTTTNATKPGTYVMSGWVDVAENVQLPFKAQAIYSGTQNLDGIDTVLTADQVASIIKYAGGTGTISKYDGNKVYVDVSGTLRGSYGLKTYTDVTYKSF